MRCIQGFGAGVDHYITKPFEPEELLAIVANTLSRLQRTHKEITRLATDSKTDELAFIRDEELTDAEWRTRRPSLAVSTIEKSLRNTGSAFELLSITSDTSWPRNN